MVNDLDLLFHAPPFLNWRRPYLVLAWYLTCTRVLLPMISAALWALIVSQMYLPFDVDRNWLAVGVLAYLLGFMLSMANRTPRAHPWWLRLHTVVVCFVFCAGCVSSVLHLVADGDWVTVGVLSGTVLSLLLMLLLHARWKQFASVAWAAVAFFAQLGLMLYLLLAVAWPNLDNTTWGTREKKGANGGGPAPVPLWRRSVFWKKMAALLAVVAANAALVWVVVRLIFQGAAANGEYFRVFNWIIPLTLTPRVILSLMYLVRYYTGAGSGHAARTSEFAMVKQPLAHKLRRGSSLLPVWRGTPYAAAKLGDLPADLHVITLFGHLDDSDNVSLGPASPVNGSPNGSLNRWRPDSATPVPSTRHNTLWHDPARHADVQPPLTPIDDEESFMLPGATFMSDDA